MTIKEYRKKNELTLQDLAKGNLAKGEKGIGCSIAILSKIESAHDNFRLGFKTEKLIKNYFKDKGIDIVFNQNNNLLTRRQYAELLKEKNKIIEELERENELLMRDYLALKKGIKNIQDLIRKVDNDTD